MASCSSHKPHPHALRTPGVKWTRIFFLFFWLKHSHASVCLMRQTGSDASGPSVLVKYNLQSSHLPLSSLSISAHWDSGHSNTILTTSSSFSWLLAKICPCPPPLPSLSFRSGQSQGLLWLQVQRTQAPHLSLPGRYLGTRSLFSYINAKFAWLWKKVQGTMNKTVVGREVVPRERLFCISRATKAAQVYNQDGLKDFPKCSFSMQGKLDL